MVQDGEYVVWFNTPGGSGTGRIRLSDGKICGSDSYLAYEGFYVTADGGRAFEAVISTRRHTRGPATFFGADEVVIRLDGTFKGAVGVGAGTVDHIPEARLEIILLPSQDAPPRPPIDYSKIQYHPERLPSPKPAR